MKKVIIKMLNKNQIYSFENIADIIDKSNILCINDYNLPKSGKATSTNWEITLGFLLSEMVNNNILTRTQRGRYILV